MRIALLVILAICAVGISAKFRVPRSADQVNPAWTCTKLDKTNAKAKDDRADGTKCQYVSYLIETLKQDYGTPQYPACFAQIDGICDSHIVDYYEKRNIKKFVEKIQVICQSDDPTWEHFQTVLNEEKQKHTDIFASDYWNCVSTNVDTFVEQEFVTGPSFPAPYLDVLNYVCQQVQADMRNIDRVNFNAWFEDQGKFENLDKVGKSLFFSIKQSIEQADDLDLELRQCFSYELGQFTAAAVPEVQGYYNVHLNEGTDFTPAFLTFDPRFGDPELPYPQRKQTSWNGAEFFAYECWNFYAPKSHYKQPKADNGKSSVTTNAFSGNKGHPLCPDNTMYQPLTRFGPMCCPIVPTFGPPPHTYNCCTASSFQFQQMKYGPATYPMPPYQECAPCTCLDGYQMVFDIDYFGLGEPRGACQQKKK